MSGRRSRTKGRDWQAALALRWRTRRIFPDAVSTQGQQKNGPGPKPPDLEGTPCWVEAHHGRKSPITKLRQAERERAAANDPRPAVAVVREHGSGAGNAVVCMRLETFEWLAKQAGVGGE